MATTKPTTRAVRGRPTRACTYWRLFHHFRPRKGDLIRFNGTPIGYVVTVQKTLCWVAYRSGLTMPFIWCHPDGLNARHTWTGKRDGLVTATPGPHRIRNDHLSEISLK